MKKIYGNKKAFTLIEVILALIIASLASVYAIQTISKNRFNESLVDFQDTISSIVKDGIASNIGYASGTGGNCSANLDFTGLTSQRLVNCLNWNRFNIQADGSMMGWDLMQNYGGCRVDVNVDPANTTRFFVFVDCSTIDYDNPIRSMERLEQAIEFVFTQKLGSLLIGTNRNASVPVINNAGTNNDPALDVGINNDGLIRGYFGL